MPIGRIITALGLAVLRAELRLIVQRAAMRVATAAIAGLFLLVAAGFLVAALTVWLAAELGTIYALLIVAAIFVVVAGIVFLLGRMQGRRRPAYQPRPAAAPVAEPKAPAGAAPSADEPPLGSELGSMAVVALAGFMLARQMLRRR